MGAWAHRGDREALLEAAAALDTMRSGGLAGGALSPMFGIPFAAKDIIQSRDFPTEYGSAVFRGNAELNQPDADAACIAQLKSRGAILIGKTDTTEFATFSANSSHNPHDPTRTPGGSSSGSAAAVADMQVPIAFGTQTNGSVIRPAGFCGVCGYDDPESDVSAPPCNNLSATTACGQVQGHVRPGLDGGHLLHGAFVPFC